MENQIPTNEMSVKETPAKRKSIKHIKQLISQHKKVVILVVSIPVVIGGFFSLKSLFIAASVDGSLISRLALIQALEKQDGARALDSLIIEKLVENETKKNTIVISNEEIDQEIKKIESNISRQGGTLNDTLSQQGMTEEGLKNNIRTQKKVEKLLADKTQVTEEEIQKYITDNKVPIPKGQEEATKNTIKAQIQRQKLNQEAQAWISRLRAQAKIKYYLKF